MSFSEEHVYNTVLRYLQPWENVLIRLQVLLSWQQPRESTIFVGVTEVILFFVCFTQSSCLFFLLFLGWIFLLHDCVHSYIWPTIKVPETTDNAEPWTSLAPQVMNVHEMARKLASLTKSFVAFWHHLRQFRQEQRTLFYGSGLFVLVTCAYLGSFVLGKTIFFCFVNVILWSPWLSRCPLAYRLHKAVFGEQVEKANENKASVSSSSNYQPVLSFLPSAPPTEDSDEPLPQQVDIVPPVIHAKIGGGESEDQEEMDSLDMSSYEFVNYEAN